MSAFVQLEGVTKRFGDNVVLKSVDLSVDEHQVVCLIGASGSGKSTLLRCVNLLERVDAAEQRRLAATRRADQADDLVLVEAEGDAA